jgi:hypothetical protein
MSRLNKDTASKFTGDSRPSCGHEAMLTIPTDTSRGNGGHASQPLWENRSHADRGAWAVLAATGPQGRSAVQRPPDARRAAVGGTPLTL